MTQYSDRSADLFSDFDEPPSGKPDRGATNNRLLKLLALVVVVVCGVAVVVASQTGDPKTEVVTPPSNGSSTSKQQGPETPNTIVSPPPPAEHAKAPPPPPLPAVPANPELFGVIEVGGSSVKGVIVDLDRGKEPDCQYEDVFEICLIQKKFDERVEPIAADAVKDTAAVVKRVFSKMTALGVDPSQIYLVGSSSVGTAEHTNQLKESIESELGRPGTLAFVSADEEARFAFEGTLQLIPSRYREDRRRQAIVLDIGSGNTKGAYKAFSGARGEPRTFEIADLGTKKFAKKVENSRGSQSFQNQAAALRVSDLRPAVRKALATHRQDLATHDRVYLLGGISWALTNLAMPNNTQRFPQVDPRFITDLYKQALQPDAKRNLCGQGQRSNPNSGETERVCKVFSIPDQLVAGLELLKTLKEELPFENKKVFFIRGSLYAWPLGYLHSRCAADQKQHCLKD